MKPERRRGHEGKHSSSEADSASAAGKGGLQPGPLGERNTHNDLQGLPYILVEIPGCLLNVTGRTGAEDVRHFWESKA